MAEREYTPTEADRHFIQTAGAHAAEYTPTEAEMREVSISTFGDPHGEGAAFDRGVARIKAEVRAEERAKRLDREQVKEVADALGTLAEMIADGLSMDDLYTHLHEHQATLLSALALEPETREESGQALHIEEDGSHIYWADPVEGCWVAFRRVDCVGEEELPDRRLPVSEDREVIDAEQVDIHGANVRLLKCGDRVRFKAEETHRDDWHGPRTFEATVDRVLSESSSRFGARIFTQEQISDGEGGSENDFYMDDDWTVTRLASLAPDPEAREEHAFDDSEGSAFCACGAGPFSNFGGSPLPAYRRHVAEAKPREVTDAEVEAAARVLDPDLWRSDHKAYREAQQAFCYNVRDALEAAREVSRG